MDKLLWYILYERIHKRNQEMVKPSTKAVNLEKMEKGKNTLQNASKIWHQS